MASSIDPLRLLIVEVASNLKTNDVCKLLFLYDLNISRGESCSQALEALSLLHRKGKIKSKKDIMDVLKSIERIDLCYELKKCKSKKPDSRRQTNFESQPASTDEKVTHLVCCIGYLVDDIERNVSERKSRLPTEAHNNLEIIRKRFDTLLLLSDNSDEDLASLKSTSSGEGEASLPTSPNKKKPPVPPKPLSKPYKYPVPESQPIPGYRLLALPEIESAKAKLKTIAKPTTKVNSSNDEVPYEDIDTSTGKDSGFCDVKEFLKAPLARSSTKPQPNDIEDDDHYEVISSVPQYTSLTTTTVETTSEYTEPRPQ